MKINNVVVVGVGLMGNGIAQISLMAGNRVTLVDIKEEFQFETPLFIFLQLFLVTVYFTMHSRETFLIGLIALLVVFATIGILFIFSRYGSEQIKNSINRGIDRFRSSIIA